MKYHHYFTKEMAEEKIERYLKSHSEDKKENYTLIHVDKVGNPNPIYFLILFWYSLKYRGVWEMISSIPFVCKVDGKKHIFTYGDFSHFAPGWVYIHNSVLKSYQDMNVGEFIRQIKEMIDCNMLY